MTEWTPTDDEVEGMFVTGWCCDTDPATAGAQPSDAYRRWLAAHDRALRKRIARDIEQYYLGPESGRFFDGRDAPDAAEMEAFDDGLQFAARLARGEEQDDE